MRNLAPDLAGSVFNLVMELVWLMYVFPQLVHLIVLARSATTRPDLRTL